MIVLIQNLHGRVHHNSGSVESGFYKKITKIFENPILVIYVSWLYYLTKLRVRAQNSRWI